MKKVIMNLQMFTTESFIPTLWSAEVLLSLKNQLVWGQEGIINRNYEGEVKGYGSTVKINGLDGITVGKYTKNTDINAPEVLSDNTRELVVDQANYFNFLIDDVDKAQQNPKLMSSAMVEASFALKQEADKYIAEQIAKATTKSITRDITTPAEAYDVLVDLSVMLDEANVPEQGRFVVIPPFFEGMIKKDERFVGVGDSTDASIKLNGLVGRVAGFNLIKANTVHFDESEKYHIVAGHSMATTYADQINEVEAYRPEKRFADAVKGLYTYGLKVVRPEALVKLVTARPAVAGAAGRTAKAK